METLANLRSEGESLAEVAHDARKWSRRWGSTAICWRSRGCSTPPSITTPANCGWWPRPAAGWWRSCWRSMPAWGPDGRPPQRPSAQTRTEAEAPGRRPAGAGPPLGSAARRADRQPGRGAAGQPQSALRPGRALHRPHRGVEGGALPVRLTGEDLTRILVNLVKNAAEAMPAAGRIAISLHEFHAGAKLTPWLVLTVEDNGPGIPAEALEQDLRLRLHHPRQQRFGFRRLRLGTAGRPLIAGWACPSPAPSSRPPEAAFMPPTAHPGRSLLRDRAARPLLLKPPAGSQEPGDGRSKPMGRLDDSPLTSRVDNTPGATAQKIS